jgi:GNAT superfamily N-acetyltransferase
VNHTHASSTAAMSQHFRPGGGGAYLSSAGGDLHSSGGQNSESIDAIPPVSATQAASLLAAERARHADAELRLQLQVEQLQRQLAAQDALVARVTADAAVQLATERARVVTLEAALAAAYKAQEERGGSGGVEPDTGGVLALQEERDSIAAALESALEEAASLRRRVEAGGAGENAHGEAVVEALRAEIAQLQQALELEWHRAREAAVAERRTHRVQQEVLQKRVAALEAANAAHSLAEALATDAFYAFVAEPTPGEHRHAALVAYFAASLAEGRSAGIVVEEANGAAMWSLPGDTPQQAAAAAVRRNALRSALGEAGLSRWDAVCSTMAVAAAAFPSLASSWYLSILGVRPSAQRTGVGRRLLAPTLAAADAVKMPCWLETYGVETLPFYGVLGFEPLTRVIEPTIGAPYWILLRQPRA